MTLNLDLRSCDVKLARAREHADALKRETEAHIGKQQATHAVRFSEVDPQTGWCSITLVPQKIEEPRLSAILGDLIHNLRSTLDYVTTVLVTASGATLTTAHQFPIYLDRARYLSKVATKTEARSDGPLRNIIHGLSVIEGWQPYYAKPDPRTDPLWAIHRFSNADKHREAAIFGMVPAGSFQIHFNGIKVEEDLVEEVEDWSPDKEIPIGRIRFDPPRAENLRAEGNIGLNILFVTPPWLGDDKLSFPLRAVPGVVEHVAKLLDSFRYL
jgi:hypothetical protein